MFFNYFCDLQKQIQYLSNVHCMGKESTDKQCIGDASRPTSVAISVVGASRACDSHAFHHTMGLLRYDKVLICVNGMLHATA